MSSLQKMMKKAQQMQRDVENAQNELAESEIEYVGNGVKVVAKGDHSIVSIDIDPELISSDDKEMLEDCIVVAVNGAVDKVKNELEKKMNKITGGFNIPGLLG